MAISKTKPAEAVREAFKAGQLVFGENRVQEAVEKIDVLQDLSGLEWHLVGHLQKNKARFCPGRFQLSVFVSVGKSALRSNLREPIICDIPMVMRWANRSAKPSRSESCWKV